MNNNEKYSEIYLIAEKLREKNAILQYQSRSLFTWRLIMVFLPIIELVFVLVAFMNFTVAIIYISILVFFTAFLVCDFIEKRTYFNLSILYQRVIDICGDLSDMVDWTTMRKRQIYNTLDDRIQGPIDDFYKYCMSRLCPYYGGKKRYKMLRIVTIEGIAMVVMYSLWITLRFSVL